MDWKPLHQKMLFVQRFCRALSGVLSALSDRLSPENGSSGTSIFTSQQIIFNKFVVVSLTWLCLIAINSRFKHGKVCSMLNFCSHTIFDYSMQITSTIPDLHHISEGFLVWYISFINQLQPRKPCRRARSLINFLELFLDFIYYFSDCT